jgi:UDP-N-acetylglucosamine 2-epimerase
MKNASTHNFFIYYPISMNEKIKDMVFQALQNSDKIYFFYNCQKNVTFMHRYQVAKYVIFDSEKIFVKKFPWMLK